MTSGTMTDASKNLPAELKKHTDID